MLCTVVEKHVLKILVKTHHVGGNKSGRASVKEMTAWPLRTIFSFSLAITIKSTLFHSEVS